jgi:tetratricopeptide (TPR) repeat protein
VSAKGRILSQQGRFADSTREGAKSFALIEPVASAAGSSIAARRAFGEIAVSHGFNLMRESDYKLATEVFEKARAALRSIDGLQLGDLSSAALFVEATAWQMDVLVPLGRIPEARKNGEEARKVADGILEKQPGHMLALRARGLLLSNFGDLAAGDLRFTAALPHYAAAARDYESFLKVDAGNTIAWNNLGANLQSLGLMTEGSGRPREGLRHVRAAAATGRQGTLTAVRAQNIANFWFHVTRIEAELGGAEASAAALAEGLRYLELAMKDAPRDSFRRGVMAPMVPLHEANRLYVLGDFRAAREKATAAAAALEKVKPETDGQRQGRAFNLSDALWTAASSAYQLRDYVAAEAAARRAAEVRNVLPTGGMFQEVFRTEYQALHALTLARLGRLPEARAALAPALAYFAGLPDAKDAEWIRLHLASMRLAQALANPPEATSRLAEAAQLVDGLSSEYRRTASVVLLRNEIALEQAARR